MKLRPNNLNLFSKVHLRLPALQLGGLQCRASGIQKVCVARPTKNDLEMQRTSSKNETEGGGMNRACRVMSASFSLVSQSVLEPRESRQSPS